VSDGAELRSAISTLRAGDLVKATTSFTVSGTTVIKNRLSSPAELDLSGVRFVYSGGQDYPAVWLDDAENVRIYGGDASTADTGGSCVDVYGSQHVLWWSFTAHDCGGSGFDVCTCAGLTVDHNDFQGTIWKVGQNLRWDPHPEKGSGEHAALLWDSKYTSAFTNNRFALYAHDIPTGACVEIGNKEAAPATGNVLYEKCVNATFVAKTQTGGNALQVWGYTDKLGLDVKYLEGENLQGYALRDGGVYSGQTLSGLTVEHGHASHTNKNPLYAGKSPWMTDSGVVYGHVRPVPKGGS
jgi:hypothetical protein